MNYVILISTVLAISLVRFHGADGHWSDDGEGVRWLKHDEYGAHEGPIRWHWNFLKPARVPQKGKKEYEDALSSHGHKNWPGWSKNQKCDHAGGYPHPKGDCTKFVICKASGAKPVEKRCKDGRLFDPFEEKCKKRAEARPCSVCIGKDGFTIPDPEDENGLKFFQCSEGLPHHYQCHNGFFFHPRTGKCEKKAVTREESAEEHEIEEKEDEIPDPDESQITTYNHGTTKTRYPKHESAEVVVDPPEYFDNEPWKPDSLLQRESVDVPKEETDKDMYDYS